MLHLLLGVTGKKVTASLAVSSGEAISLGFLGALHLGLQKRGRFVVLFLATSFRHHEGHPVFSPQRYNIPWELGMPRKVSLEKLLKELPEKARNEVLDFASYLLEKYLREEEVA